MPYIAGELRRAELNRADTGKPFPANAGELTFVLTKIINAYWKRGKRFQQIAEIRGALESTLHEFNRRVADPYEDKKMQENGDVF